MNTTGTTAGADQGKPLNVELSPKEFRWRPYGYAVRHVVTHAGKEVPGPVDVVLLPPELPRDQVARKSEGRWKERNAWRSVMNPDRETKRWNGIWVICGVLAGSLAFLVAVGRLDWMWPVPVTVAVFLAVMLTVSRVGAVWSHGRLQEISQSPEFGFLRVTLDGGGYGDMAREFDQVAEAWTRGRVQDGTWQDVWEAVVAAITEYADHSTPADKANPEWMTAMVKLDTVRTKLGQEGQA
ncbi:MAG: hypothetical protein L0G46_03215 [Kocuria sp.]|nr:hypothetical protein [Kocuria sp.]